MANKNIISIGLKIDQGTDGFANLTIDAGNFHELMKAIVQDVKEFSNHVDGFTALADNIGSGSRYIEHASGSDARTDRRPRGSN